MTLEHRRQCRSTSSNVKIVATLLLFLLPSGCAFRSRPETPRISTFVTCSFRTKVKRCVPTNAAFGRKRLRIPNAGTSATHVASSTTCLSQQHDGSIDLQCDTSQYGRGEQHLTFCLEENDIVVYQEGTWYVDGVAVGPGDEPTWSYAIVDTIQINWTHNCEHGVVRGYRLELDRDEMTLRRTDDDIDFGPEQIVARINNVEWKEDASIAIPPLPLSGDLWRATIEEY
mmetsp:Transcript_5959/g.13060  ORF Transcript_5959/g.13060 Transcript_5959/m.13060 type:complete len:228 (+) Transcript_5959:268-951(+)